jgi:nucleoside-diphosphate-sugar epimerase
MQTEPENVKIRSAYNLAAISFTPVEISNEIKKHLPGFEISYEPDFRQKIADSWPASIDDSFARKDWGWQHQFDLSKTTKIMLEQLKNHQKS